MDICFIEFNEWIHLRVNSVHGMLWLQTHFDESQWEVIASQQVKLTKNNARALAQDATEAGLILNSVQSALNFSNS